MRAVGESRVHGRGLPFSLFKHGLLSVWRGASPSNLFRVLHANFGPGSRCQHHRTFGQAHPPNGKPLLDRSGLPASGLQPDLERHNGRSRAREGRPCETISWRFAIVFRWGGLSLSVSTRFADRTVHELAAVPPSRSLFTAPSRPIRTKS